MLSLVLATALATAAPTPAATQPMTNCVQSDTCSMQSEMHGMACSMMAAPSKSAGLQQSNPSRGDDRH